MRIVSRWKCFVAALPMLPLAPVAEASKVTHASARAHVDVPRTCSHTAVMTFIVVLKHVVFRGRGTSLSIPDCLPTPALNACGSAGVRLDPNDDLIVHLSAVTRPEPGLFQTELTESGMGFAVPPGRNTAAVDSSDGANGEMVVPGRSGKTRP